MNINRFNDSSLEWLILVARVMSAFLANFGVLLLLIAALLFDWRWTVPAGVAWLLAAGIGWWGWWHQGNREWFKDRT